MLIAERELVQAPSARQKPKRRWPIKPEYLAKRIGAAALAVWGAVTIVFLMVSATGDPALALAPEDANDAEIAAIRERLGFDQPIYVQYVRFLVSLVTGSFPSSLYSQQSALTVVLDRLPASLLLAGVGIAIAILIGFGVGYYSVFGKARRLRMAVLNFVMVFQAVPNFLIGIVLILIFSLRLHWFPTSGYSNPLGLVMPALTIGLALAPNIARILRSSLQEQLGADYVNTARAKGVSINQVRIRHIFANSLVPVITLIGLQAGGLLGGIVVIETVFAWPGLGGLLIKSVNLHDYPVVVTAVVVISLAYVTLSLLVDILVAILSPRSQS